jgi:hypothetical protein
MSLSNVWSRVLRRSALARRRQQTQKPARQRRSLVPRLELLEDRTVLSTLTIVQNKDLRSAVRRPSRAASPQHAGSTSSIR